MKKPASTRHRTATLISRIFDPLVLLVPLIALALVRSHAQFWQQMWFLLVFVFGMLIPPVLLFVWAIKKGFVSDWDVSIRSQRIKVLAVLLVFAVFDVLIVYLLGNRFMFSLSFLFILWLTGFFLITRIFKISGHTGFAALAFGLVALWFGQSWYALYMFLPVIAWARLIRKDHSPFQTASGIVYSFVWLIIYRALLM